MGGLTQRKAWIHGGNDMTPGGYSRTQIVLHWVVAVLVLAQFLFHDPIAEAFERGIEGEGFRIGAGVALHMAGGGLILILAALRMNLRRERGVPAPPEGEPPWQVALARAVHLGIYVLFLLVPVSGGIAWGQGSEAAGEVHEALKNALFALVLLHVAGALHGQFVRKTGVIARMVWPER